MEERKRRKWQDHQHKRVVARVSVHPFVDPPQQVPACLPGDRCERPKKFLILGSPNIVHGISHLVVPIKK